jgi:tetratricopeptide (TPR) repeat protein
VPYDIEVPEPFEEEDDFEEAEPGPEEAEPGPAEAFLEAPEELARIEDAWDEVWPLPKPFATLALPFDPDDVWEAATADGWLAFLEREPAALDCLTILDDLLQALFQAMPVATIDETLAKDVMALHDAFTCRAEAILDATLAGRTLRLPWPWTENRPLLRLLTGRVTVLEGQDPAAAIALIERLLALDPEDNHGLRGRLIDHRLCAGDDEGALALADAYPLDTLPEILWGRVLAHYRRGDRGHALTALAEAHRHQPEIGAALASRAARRFSAVPDDFFGDDLSGGEAEAEAYVESMGEAWASVPGLVDWLRATRRGLPKRPGTPRRSR